MIPCFIVIYAHFGSCVVSLCFIRVSLEFRVQGQNTITALKQTTLNQKPIYPNQANVALCHCLCQPVIVMARRCRETVKLTVSFYYYSVYSNVIDCLF